METTNVLIAGVGGQGLVLATEILSQVAFKEGYDIKSGDVIGLSQRGGKVWGSVRFGEKVHSPLIPEGEVDIMLAMEQLEGLRWSHQLKSSAVVVLNNDVVYPNKVLLEKEDYPENIEEKLLATCAKVVKINANAIAKEAGNIKTVNIALLGTLAKFLPFKNETWLEVIKNNVPKSTIDVNINAFNLAQNI
jgi:indolepyruvate ferredoxin oxidoreductase beta subunit